MAYKKENTTRLREYKVIKSNELIQKTRFQLSVQEQKIILFMISKIRPNDEDFITLNFGIQEFCKICGIDEANGANYKYIKETVKTLSNKSAWITLDDGTEVLSRWINKAWINKKSGFLKLRLDDDMKPYLLQLQSRFTQYELLYTLAMKSQYSIRLYEILKSYEYKRKYIFDIDDLKKILFAEHYNRFPDFKRYVLDISLREINNFSDLKADYEVIKVGRRFARLEFIITLKKDMTERLQTWANIDKIINPF